MTGEKIFNPDFLNLEYIFGKILDILSALYRFFTGNFFFLLIAILSIIAIVFLLYIILYTQNEIQKIQNKEDESLKVSSKKVVSQPKNSKWQKIQPHIRSNNSSDWRIAILEADMMLEDLLIELGYEGANLGEMLLQVEKSDFITLNDAWESHKVRNRIAHEGSTFEISQKEAYRVIQTYEKVFNEFKFI